MEEIGCDHLAAAGAHLRADGSAKHATIMSRELTGVESVSAASR
jgi:hypothetical protein